MEDKYPETISEFTEEIVEDLRKEGDVGSTKLQKYIKMVDGKTVVLENLFDLIEDERYDQAIEKAEELEKEVEERLEDMNPDDDIDFDSRGEIEARFFYNMKGIVEDASYNWEVARERGVIQ